ncbi:hypothetical protein [Dyella sp.]|uniref:hypothetical protein n=1 Tax=Dyella sp. TaxID=1869338 RepID=UPI00283EB767|nr:hypothetical protein [Dyella sp.]MDR3444139.1 hypothetical protein [Dyella sp.]
MNGMLDVKGIPLEKGEKLNFVWNADLVSFDGPLISLFKKGDDDFLFVWVDCDKSHNRWVVVPVERLQLQGYLTHTVTLLDIFRGASTALVFESTKKAQRRNYRLVEISQLPSEYLPQSDSHLTASLATEAAAQLAMDLPSTYLIKLDGELYLDDLASVPKLYQQLYSFHYGLEHLVRPAVKDALQRLLEKWRGGINAVNIFTGLRSVTPSIHRVQVKGLQYASPGHIKLELLTGLAAEITAACARIVPEKDFKASEDLYGEVYSYFRAEKLAGFDREGVVKSTVLTSSQTKRLNEFVDQYFKLMGWSPYAANFSALGLDSLAKIRMLLAYYRRLRGLRRYVVEKKVELT